MEWGSFYLGMVAGAVLVVVPTLAMVRVFLRRERNRHPAWKLR